MNYKQCAKALLEHDNFIILTHRNPDGDTCGSSAALCLGLRSLGKTCHILQNPEITPRLAFLHEGLTRQEPEEGDILVTVDDEEEFNAVSAEFERSYEEGDEYELQPAEGEGCGDGCDCGHCHKE